MFDAGHISPQSWAQTEAELRKTLQTCAQRAWPDLDVRDPACTHPARNFFISVTEMEVHQGLIQRPDRDRSRRQRRQGVRGAAQQDLRETALLPQLSHVVVGGESTSLVIVQLASMAVRCVLAPLDDWCARAACLSLSLSRLFYTHAQMHTCTCITAMRA